MGWFDDAEVRRFKEEKERADEERRLAEQRRQAEHAELMTFTIQGLQEFPEAPREGGLPAQKREVVRSGSLSTKPRDGWLLLTSESDGSYLSHYWVDTEGGLWLDTDPSSPERVAQWIAKVCDYDPDAIRATLTAALAGVPLTRNC